jgi:hypothetical protein
MWLMKIVLDGTQLVNSETESEDEEEFGGFAGQMQNTSAHSSVNERFRSPIF